MTDTPKTLAAIRADLNRALMDPEPDLEAVARALEARADRLAADEPHATRTIDDYRRAAQLVYYLWSELEDAD